ncbi:Pro-neuregulin-3, membrane-bound isoform [Takifugu flavidus]|uniref:Pro-neuregulin-3, membrane-bound isoform n=1 Tax=Takifugu flavidus TaxID=433684 RepID=A0A5C6PQR3_9TELE|nr:Pro-neuregulin-3, membrane-bound isoform [Takifugu flavidus]
MGRSLPSTISWGMRLSTRALMSTLDGIHAVAPTLPSLRSEVFKPCVEDKDLAFCLNEGECSIIETVAGVHRHCSCSQQKGREAVY